MDAALGRAMERIARDRRSGAAELALAATDALLEWTRRRPRPAEAELCAVAGALLLAQPVMAPLIRLANEVALAMDSPRPAAALRRELRQFRRMLRDGPRRIASHFHHRLAKIGMLSVCTYSYSSTVVRALATSGNRLAFVVCSEARPAAEGRRMAATLARAGIPVLFMTDAELIEGSPDAAVLVVGADGVNRSGFQNKAGTELLAERFLRAGRRVWVLADTTKFWSARQGKRAALAEAPAGLYLIPRYEATGLWDEAPRGVCVFSKLFAQVAWRKPMAVLTERGWMTPRQVQRALAKIKVSPRLGELVR